MYGSRRYGWRSETSLASRSTVSSGLTEKFSSSSEEDEPVISPISQGWTRGAARDPTSSNPTKISTFDALRRPLLKRKAKTWFLRLTTEAKPHKADSERQKRRESAKALVDILENQPDGEDIVARRFTKTAERQQAGLQALLRLSDDEPDQVNPALTNMNETDSSCLLTMLLEHSKGRTLFQDSLTNILENATFGIAG
ncbi:hypothetical protein FRC00_000467, partial [Tulasnella sp. 408]